MRQLALFENKNTNEGVTKLDITGFKSNCPDKVRPFLRYPGSKYNATKYIEPFWSGVNFSEYREPFLGSGAVFFKMPKVQLSILNDLDVDLINCFKAVQDKDLLMKLKRDVVDVLPSKDWFNKLRETKPETNYDNALKYFLINRTAYSGIMKLPNWGFHEKKSVQPIKWPERLDKAHEKLHKNVLLTSNHFRDIIDRPSNNKVWMFIDPPYFAADQKRAYLKYFNLNDHLELAEHLKNTNHKFCLTYDNCNEIKELYKWANIYEIEWMYHTANSNVTSRKKGKELIITNY